MANNLTSRLMNDLKEKKELATLIRELQEPQEILEFVREQGYDVTMEDLIEVEKQLRAQRAKHSDETVLSINELSMVAGGLGHEDGPDGHEIGCSLSYHDIYWSFQHRYYCKADNICVTNSVDYSCKGQVLIDGKIVLGLKCKNSDVLDP